MLVGLKIIIVNEKQVCFQPLQSADYVALPAFAAARRAAAPLLLTAGPPAVQQSIDVTWLSGPQQQTRTSGVRRRMEQTGRRGDDHGTDARAPDGCTDPAEQCQQVIAPGAARRYALCQQSTDPKIAADLRPCGRVRTPQSAHFWWPTGGG